MIVFCAVVFYVCGYNTAMRTNKRQYLALRDIHYDLFEAATAETAVERIPIRRDIVAENTGRSLPPLAQLYRMYDAFNEECFNGRLPAVKISYSNRMLIAGSFMPSTREIKIGRKYHTIFPDDLADTLKHEMIHVIYPNHDRGFKALAAKLGVSLKAKAHPDLRGSYKYLYVCPVCGREYPRRKRLRMASCGVCSKGRSFDSCCKLQLARVKK